MKPWLERLDANPRARDGVVAAIWLLIGIALVQFGAVRLWDATVVLHSSGSAFLILLCAIAAVSTLRSRRPHLALALGAVLTTVDLLFGGSLGVILVFTDLIYAAFKYGSDRGVRVIAWLIAGLVVLAAVFLSIWRPGGMDVQIIAAQLAVVLFAAAMWGWNVRSERMRTSAAMTQEHLRSTQLLRKRIALDLHDLVANQIAVASLHVEAAKLHAGRAGALSRAAEQSLHQAAVGTRLADQQLRRMIQMLHTVDDLSEPAGASVAQLVGEGVRGLDRMLPGDRSLRWRGAGQAELINGLMSTPAPQTRVMLRVLHEIIANAVKYGRGDISVHIDQSAGLSLTVTNDVLLRQPASLSSGIGISGARLLLAGTGARLESGPSDDGRSWVAALDSGISRS